MKTSITFKIALPMILTGAFIIIIFFAVPQAIQINPILIVILLFVGVFVFFYGFSTGQRIAFPVRDLLRKAKNLSEGDLKTRSYSNSKDEIGQLAIAFNKIADDLEESCNNQASGEKSIKIKVKAKTRELEETIKALEQKIKNRTIELERLTSENDQLKQEIEGLGQKLGVSKVQQVPKK
jgi:methyl-accepting chemotaxis protein